MAHPAGDTNYKCTLGPQGIQASVDMRHARVSHPDLEVGGGTCGCEARAIDRACHTIISFWSLYRHAWGKACRSMILYDRVMVSSSIAHVCDSSAFSNTSSIRVLALCGIHRRQPYSLHNVLPDSRLMPSYQHIRYKSDHFFFHSCCVITAV